MSDPSFPIPPGPDRPFIDGFPIPEVPPDPDIAPDPADLSPVDDTAIADPPTDCNGEYNSQSGKPRPYNLKHGMRMDRSGFRLTQAFRKSYPGIHQAAVELRRELEGYVRDEKGDITLNEKRLIHTACRHEVCAKLMERRMANPELSDELVVDYVMKLQRATEARDGAIAALKLGERAPKDPLADLSGEGGTENLLEGS